MGMTDNFVIFSKILPSWLRLTALSQPSRDHNNSKGDACALYFKKSSLFEENVLKVVLCVCITRPLDIYLK